MKHMRQKNIVVETGSDCKVIGNDNFTFDETYAAKNIVVDTGSDCKVIGNDNFTFDEAYAAKKI